MSPKPLFGDEDLDTFTDVVEQQAAEAPQSPTLEFIENLSKGPVEKRKWLCNFRPLSSIPRWDFCACPPRLDSAESTEPTRLHQ